MADSGPHYPVVAFGKSKTGTVSSAVVAGTNVFTSAGHTFVEGETLWLSKSDDSGNQCLGLVTDVDGNDVTTARGANGAKGASSKIWTAPAAQLVVFSTGPTGDYEPESDSNIVFESTQGGTSVATRVGGRIDRLILTFSPGRVLTSALVTADWLAWRTFLRDKIREGLDTFSLALWDMEENVSAVREVRYMSPISSVSFGTGRKFASFSLLFQIESADEYVV